MNACITCLVLTLFIIVAAHESSFAEDAQVHNLRSDIDALAPLSLKANLRIGSDDEDTALGRVADVVVNSSGVIFVLDRAFVTIFVFDVHGNKVKSFSREGEGPGELMQPAALAVDSNDTLYVADHNRITTFDPNGEYVRSTTIGLGGAFVRSIRLAGESQIVLSAFEIFDRKILHRFDQQGELLGSFCESYAVGMDIDVREEATFAGGPMDVAPNGDICFSQISPYEIRRFSPTGELLMSIYRENDFVTEPHSETRGEALRMYFPTGSYGLVALNDGRLVNCIQVVGQEAGGIKTIVDVFAPDGKLLGTAVSRTPISLKCGDHSNQLYGVEVGDVQKVVRYNLE